MGKQKGGRGKSPKDSDAEESRMDGGGGGGGDSDRPGGGQERTQRQRQRQRRRRRKLPSTREREQHWLAGGPGGHPSAAAIGRRAGGQAAVTVTVGSRGRGQERMPRPEVAGRAREDWLDDEGWRGTCGRLIYRGQDRVAYGGGTAAAAPRGMRRTQTGRWWGPRSTSFQWQLGVFGSCALSRVGREREKCALMDG